MITNLVGVPHLLLIIFGFALKGLSEFLYKYEIYHSFNIVDCGQGTDILTNKSYKNLNKKKEISLLDKIIIYLTSYSKFWKCFY